MRLVQLYEDKYKPSKPAELSNWEEFLATFLSQHGRMDLGAINPSLVHSSESAAKALRQLFRETPAFVCWIGKYDINKLQPTLKIIKANPETLWQFLAWLTDSYTSEVGDEVYEELFGEIYGYQPKHFTAGIMKIEDYLRD